MWLIHLSYAQKHCLRDFGLCESDNELVVQHEQRFGIKKCLVQGLAKERADTLELSHKLVPEISGTTKTSKGAAATVETLHVNKGLA